MVRPRPLSLPVCQDRSRLDHCQTENFGAQVNLVMMAYQLMQFAKCLHGIIKEHLNFCLNPISEPLNPVCMLPADQPQRTGV